MILTAGIDIDEVLRRFVDRLIEVYKKDYPDHEIKEITEWKLSPFFPIGKGINNYYAYSRAPEIYGHAACFEGAQEFLDNLKKLGCNVILISSQPSDIAKEFTIKWLSWLNFSYDALVFTSQKYKIHCDIYLGDSPDNIEELIKYGKRAVYFTRKWNENKSGERVSSFNEFIKLIEEIIKNYTDSIDYTNDTNYNDNDDFAIGAI